MVCGPRSDSVEGRAVIWGGPGERQTKRHVHPASESQSFEYRHPDIVVGNYYGIGESLYHPQKDRVSREWVGKVYTGFPQFPDRWNEDSVFLVSEKTSVRSVRIQRTNRNSGGCDFPVLTQTTPEEGNLLLDPGPGQTRGHLPEREVSSSQQDTERPS